MLGLLELLVNNPKYRDYLEALRMTAEARDGAGSASTVSVGQAGRAVGLLDPPALVGGVSLRSPAATRDVSTGATLVIVVGATSVDVLAWERGTTAWSEPRSIPDLDSAVIAGRVTVASTIHGVTIAYKKVGSEATYVRTARPYMFWTPTEPWTTENAVVAEGDCGRSHPCGNR